MDQRILFWMQLDEYRQAQCGTEPVSKEAAEQILKNFRNQVLWYELTDQQRRDNKAHSILFTILHKRTGWKHVAITIMQFGLPKLATRCDSNDVEQHIRILADFTVAMATWLQTFASCMLSYRNSHQYIRSRAQSEQALEERRNRRCY